MPGMAITAAVFDPLIDLVRARSPELLRTLETVIGETMFGIDFISHDIERLPKQARILEVGAGALLLSCLLQRDGFDVTALEPTGRGFSHLQRLRAIVIEWAEAGAFAPRLLEAPAERLSENACFDYAFSVNVMEHVQNLEAALTNVMGSLKPAAHYHFTCPNYLFPYEPHFNIPTLFSKALTERVFRKRIYCKKEVADPQSTWKSLNWITVMRISSIVARWNGYSIHFGRNLLAVTLQRVVNDTVFASRRSDWLVDFLKLLVLLRLHLLSVFVPATLQPIIDCTVVRAGEAGQ